MNNATVRTRKRIIADDPLPTPRNFDVKELRLFVEYVSPAELKAAARMLRQHQPKNLKPIEASIGKFGFVFPIVVDSGRRIIAGHGRWLAAKAMGLERVPVIEVSHLNHEQVRLLAIADNKIASLVGLEHG